MAKTLAFDPDDVLEKAMHIFWENGIENVSISMLVESTGVQRSGLYNVFGNKEELFLQSLQMFIDNFVKSQFAAFIRPNADINDIKYYFQRFNPIVDSPDASSGCFMCNTAASTSPKALMVEDAIAETFSDIVSYFKKALKYSRQKKMIKSTSSDQQLAESLLGSILALSTMCRSTCGKKIAKSYLAELQKKLDNL